MKHSSPASPSDPDPHPARQILIDLVVMTGIGLVLALLGPFGSFALPFAYRLVYWLGLAWAGYACYRPIGALITRLGPVLDIPQWALWVIACLIATVPMTLVVWLVSALPPPLEIPSLPDWLATYGYVLAIGTVVSMVFYVVQSKQQPRQAAGSAIAPAAQVADPAPSPAAAAAPAVRPKLLERISAGLGDEILALQMEDHYLRIHTRLGSDLILLRMRDALNELGEMDGLQVHRSWWVARAAVIRAEREGRNVRLVLHGGLIVPVARNQVPLLKAAGWPS